MKHARADYQPIQDPRGLIPENEPVSLLRGQDRLSPVVVRLWADLAQLCGVDENTVNLARGQACQMEMWQGEHGGTLPDA